MGEGGFTLGDTLEDEAVVSVLEVLTTAQLRAATAELTAVELFVVLHRTGLSGARPQSLNEIATAYGKSRETARKAEVSGMAKVDAWVRANM